ncbi:hypothetical protein [Aquamicrobium soli]|uniref:DUF1508 domain-containing protein n=1 Tax=Aquamicrobium soli TaxID=1811518 RepID=A0ABV7K970_9HYPH
MTEKTRVEEWQGIRIRRTDAGWDFCMAKKDGAIISKGANKASTFDDAVTAAKKQFDVS